MLYTGKGDNGTTKLFACDGRLHKSEDIVGALGEVDELNSWLGVCRAVLAESTWDEGIDPVSIIEVIQDNLFVVQAELAQAPGKSLSARHIVQLEEWINTIEQKIPPIKSFVVAGQAKTSAHLDYARSVSRRTERAVLRATRLGPYKVKADTATYLNRLSSVLYALARYCNFKTGREERSPNYD